MKRRDKTEKKPLFSSLEKKKKPVVGEETSPKTIRHLERTIKLPFLTKICRINGACQRSRQH